MCGCPGYGEECAGVVWIADRKVTRIGLTVAEVGFVAEVGRTKEERTGI